RRVCGADENALDRVGQPVERAFEEPLPTLVVEGVCHELRSGERHSCADFCATCSCGSRTISMGISRGAVTLRRTRWPFLRSTTTMLSPIRTDSPGSRSRWSGISRSGPGLLLRGRPPFDA